MRYLLFILALAASAAPLAAQRLQPAGVVQTRAHMPTTPYASGRPLVPQSFADDDEGRIWIWTAVGALTGAVAGGILAAVDVSHSEDGFIPGGWVIGAGAGLGALAGGIIGALAYVGSHADPQR